MRKRIAALTLIAVFSLCALCEADFKYTETSQMTGGMMQGMMKFAGALSKNARQANAPMQTTVYVKGNRLRRDETGGKVHIIDLDGRRMIDLDTNQHTYSVITFEQMRQARELALAKAKQAQAQQPKAASPANAQTPNVTITPKFEITPTGATRTILYRPAKEVKMRAEMQMQSDDPRAQGQTASFIVTADSWIAPTVPGYDEIRNFNQRMAKEFDWVPSAVFGGGGNGAGAGNVHIAPAMVELKKQSANLEGFPLLQYTSIGMGGTMPPGATGNPGQQPPQGMQQQQQQDQQQKPQLSPADMVPQVAIAKAVGAALWHRRKQQQDQGAQGGSGAAPANNTPPPTAAPPGAFQPGSLMDMTTEVNSFSSESLPSELFDIPAGYTQVQTNPEQALGTGTQQ